MYEIFVARRITEGCHATRSSVLHVLVDVTKRVCGNREQ